MPGTVPNPTPVRRIIYLPNLAVYLRLGRLFAPNTLPKHSGWIPTHNVQMQATRASKAIACGPGGTLHDYVPFYFGTHTPMMYQLHTGNVPGYTYGQQELIYLVSTAQTIQQAGRGFVFTDGQGYAAFTKYFDDLAHLPQVDWNAVQSRYWGFNNDPTGELQRKKQAEFLVYDSMDWALVREIAVFDTAHKRQVDTMLQNAVQYPPIPVLVRRNWYF